MLKTLVIKELRESAGILAVALLAVMYVLASVTGMRFVPVPVVGNMNGLPFISDGFSMALALVVGALAIALGLKQSAWETSQGTYYFLLHRPASRKLIFGLKLALGSALVVGIGGLLVLLYAVWAATPGNTATPFAWSMTARTWQLLLCLVLVYFGAFFSGIRPARWYGTRLVPLVAAAGCAFVLFWVPWWWLVVIGVALLAALIIVSILRYVHQRDY